MTLPLTTDDGLQDDQPVGQSHPLGLTGALCVVTFQVAVRVPIVTVAAESVL